MHSSQSRLQLLSSLHKLVYLHEEFVYAMQGLGTVLLTVHSKAHVSGKQVSQSFVRAASCCQHGHIYLLCEAA